MKHINKFLFLFLLLFLFVSIFLNGCLNNTGNLSYNNELEDFCYQFIKKGKYYNVWSDTTPQINKTHIFCGQINSKGKPVGFHAKLNGKNSSTAKIKKIIDKNKKGIYQAHVEILDIKYNIWKSKFSTMFPDKYTMDEIISMIVYAYNNKYFLKNKKFRGPSGKGFDIQGYILSDGKINTAYPVFK